MRLNEIFRENLFQMIRLSHGKKIIFYFWNYDKCSF